MEQKRSADAAAQVPDIRSFILQKEQTPEDDGKEIARKKKKTEVSYGIVLANEPDFIIQRITKQTSRLFVCLITQAQFYLKDEKTGDITMLRNDKESAKALARFVQDASEDICTGVQWLKKLRKGPEAQERLLKFVSQDTVLQAIKKGFIDLEDIYSVYIEDSRYCLRRSYDILKKAGALKVAEICFQEIEKRHGAEAARKVVSRAIVKRPQQRWERDYEFRMEDEDLFISEQVAALMKDGDLYMSSIFGGKSGFRTLFGDFLDYAPCNGIPVHKNTWLTLVYPRRTFKDHLGELTEEIGVQKVLERYPQETSFKTSSLIDYIIHQAPRQGYDDPEGFLEVWCDVLQMQIALYGKITDKYPEHLESMHRKLSHLFNITEIEIDMEKFEERVNEILPNEYRDDVDMIIAPRKKADILMEAQQQSNCLASYITKFTNGGCDLYFMRKVKAPKESLVTVEVIDGTVVQAKGYANRSLKEGERKFLKKWADKKGLAF